MRWALGLGLTAALAGVVSVLVAPQIRAGSTLAVLAGREEALGGVAPRLGVPWSVLLLGLAVGLLLAGAARCTLLVRVPVPVVAAAVLGPWFGEASFPGSLRLVPFGLLGLTLLLVLVPLPVPRAAGGRRGAWSGAVQWTIVGVALAAALLGHAGLVRAGREGGTPFAEEVVGGTVAGLRSYVVPLLLVAGLGFADVAWRLSDEVAAVAGRARRALPLLVVIVLALRVLQVALALVVLAVLTARRQGLDAPRWRALLLAAVLSYFVREQGLSQLPLDRLVPLGQAGLVAVATLWGAVTGGAWTSGDSARLPRDGRVLLHVGYVVLGLAVLFWATVTLDAGTVDAVVSDGATNGFGLLGVPLLVLAACATLARPAAAPAAAAPAE